MDLRERSVYHYYEGRGVLDDTCVIKVYLLGPKGKPGVLQILLLLSNQKWIHQFLVILSLFRGGGCLKLL